MTGRRREIRGGARSDARSAATREATSEARNAAASAATGEAASGGTLEPPPVYETPCIGICTIHDETGWCFGCKRTRAEIARWMRMSDAERAAVDAALEARRFTREQRQRFRAQLRARLPQRT